MSPSLVLGTAQFGLQYGVANKKGPPSDVALAAMLEAAVALGVQRFDTAPAYGDAESRLGRLLTELSLLDQVRFTTKLPKIPEGSVVREFVTQSLEQSQRDLRVDVLDVVLLHAPQDLKLHGVALLDALQSAQAAGTLRALGVSAYDADEIEIATSAGLEAVQLPYSVADRRFASNMDALQSSCLVSIRSVLLQGVLTMAPDDLPAKLGSARPWLEQFRSIARDHDMDPVAAAIGFAASAPADELLLGVESLEQIQQAAAAMKDVPASLVAALTQLDTLPATIVDPRGWS